MHIMDLVIQGVRRFTESRKFPLKPGFNVVFGPTETGKSTLLACLVDLLYPDRITEESGTLVSWGGAQASRAGLTISSGRDTYRILKDFKTQSINLSHYNPASQKFEPMASDASQVASIISSTFEMPTFDAFNHLFISTVDRMPSHLPLTIEEAQKVEQQAAEQQPQGGMQDPFQQGSAPGMPPGMMSAPGMPPGMMPGAVLPGMSGPGMMPGAAVGQTMIPGMMPGAAVPQTMFPGMMPMPGMPGAMHQFEDDGMTPEEREKKLKQTREELKSAEKVEELQYDIDGLQQKVFEIENQKKGVSQFDEFLNEAKEQLGKYPALSRLPQNIDERLDNYHDLQSLQAKEIENIDRGALEFEDELWSLQGYPPIHKQQMFMGGAIALVAGVVAFLAGPMVASILQTVGAIAAVGGVVAMAINGFLHITRVSRRDELQSRVNDLEEKKNQVIKRYEVEVSVLNKLMEDTDSDAVEEMKNKIQKYRELDERFRQVSEKKKKKIKELNLEKLDREDKDLKEKIAKLEEELRKHPPLSMDISEMRREIGRIEKVIRATNPNSPLLKQAAPAAPAPGMGVPDFGAGAGAAPGSTAVISSPGTSGATRMLKTKSLKVKTAPQAYERLLETSATMFQIERNKLIKHIQERLNLYIQALFGKRYSEARIDPDGSIALRTTDGGKWVDFEHLTPAARDTGYLAMQITLLELATQKKSLPVLLDNPLSRMDETAAMVATKALKRVSERTQVLLFCTQRGPLQFADHRLQLG